MLFSNLIIRLKTIQMNLHYDTKNILVMHNYFLTMSRAPGYFFFKNCCTCTPQPTNDFNFSLITPSPNCMKTSPQMLNQKSPLKSKNCVLVPVSAFLCFKTTAKKHVITLYYRTTCKITLNNRQHTKWFHLAQYIIYVLLFDNN